MSSIFFYANVLASYLVMALTVVMGLWMEVVGEGGRRKREEGRTKKEVRKIRWLPITPYPSPLTPYPSPLTPYPIQNHPAGWLMAIAAADTVALILTNSRNAWAIAALSCLVLAVYHGWRWLLIAVGSITTSILGASFGPSPVRDGLRSLVPAFFWARLTDELYPNRPVATLRTTQWQFAWSLTQQRPWTGWGLRSFSPLYAAQTQHQLGHPHNLLLMLLCETGIPATMVLVSLVGGIVIQAVLWLRSGPDRALVFTFWVAFLSCAGFSLFDITLFDARINWMGWMLLASIWGTTRSPTS